MARSFLFLLVACGLAAPGFAQTEPIGLLPSDLANISWRSVGPANMGGRIVDLAVREDKPAVFYFGAATGGVWKTTNGGTTFTPVFDDQGTGSIGAVALAPSRPETVWVGTGEANARNSASYGDGVYKSTDGGKTWQNMGLRETRHIGRIRVHPTDPDTVYVAALGHVWGPNPMRGLYKTTDGGATWAQVLAIDDDTGCIDVRLHPHDPNVVYAAAYEVRRDGFDTNDPAVKYGEKAGIYRSTDGGARWVKLSGGLPTVKYGRVGLETCAAQPDWLFAVVETEFTGRPAPPPTGDEAKGGPAYLGVSVEDNEGDVGAKVNEVTPRTGAAKAGVKPDDVITRIGDRKVTSYDSMLEAIRAHKAGDASKITLTRGGEELTLDVTFGSRLPERVPGTLGGQGANRGDRQGPTGYQTGGIYVSKDRGEKWERVNSLTPRPFYYSQIRVDPTNPDNIWCLGTQMHTSTNGGKRFSPNGARGIHVDHHAMWIDPANPKHLILGNDGGLYISWDRGRSWETISLMPLSQFYGIAVDNRVPYRIYGGLQDNGSWGFPSRVRSTYGITHEHVFRIGGGDGFLCAVDPTDPDVVYSESQGGNLSRINVRTGASARVRRPGQAGGRGGRGGGGARGGRGNRSRLRFNWETPLFISPHNPHTLYWAGNQVIKSVNRGASSKTISGNIARGRRGTASALAESPVREGVLWVGTDDGALHVTKDGGAEWINVTENLPALVDLRWISHIEASRSGAGTAYIVIDGHRSHDFKPHVWKTTDYGQTFTNLSAGIPEASTKVLREDPTNADILYVGLEIGIAVSIDGGETWARMKGNLPTVRVDDIVIHPTAKEIVLGTHGRGVWIADASAVQQLTETVLERDLHCFTPKDAIKWRMNTGTGRYGARRFRAPTPSNAVISYWLGRKPREGERVSVEIHDGAGKRIARIRNPGTRPGINEVTWNFRSTGAQRGGRRGGGSGGRGGGRRGGGRGGRFGGGAAVGPGTYRVTVKMGDLERSVALNVLPDPILAEDTATTRQP